jgi:hypothetical protein
VGEAGAVGRSAAGGEVELAVPGGITERLEVPGSTAIGIGLALGATVVLGIWPAPLFSFVHAAGLLF